MALSRVVHLDGGLQQRTKGKFPGCAKMSNGAMLTKKSNGFVFLGDNYVE